jgi:MAF protein
MVEPTVEAKSLVTASTLEALPVILASTSPRRRELMTLTGWPTECQSVDIDESPRPGEDAPTMTRRLAAAKAEAARAATPNGVIVLAADTVVADGGEPLGKPRDDAEAFRMLRDLRARRHTVVTSLAVLAPDGKTLLEDTCCTEVPMRDYTDTSIESFVAAGRARDKAGAYAIQDADFEPVDVGALRGCYANVMGLPLCHVVRTLRKLGLEPRTDVPGVCQDHTGYSCPVFADVLRGAG